MSEFLRHYAEIMTDPAHFLAELSFTVLVDVLGLGVLGALLKRWVRREHRAIDAEHGVTHPEPAREVDAR